MNGNRLHHYTLFLDILRTQSARIVTRQLTGDFFLAKVCISFFAVILYLTKEKEVFMQSTDHSWKSSVGFA